jgi:hypothetical protein
MSNREEIYKFALEHALKKIEKNMEDLKDFFPFVTVKGRWEICKDEDWDLDSFKDGYWCNGFWIGLLWLAYKHTKNDKFKEKIRHNKRGIFKEFCFDCGRFAFVEI